MRHFSLLLAAFIHFTFKGVAADLQLLAEIFGPYVAYHNDSASISGHVIAAAEPNTDKNHVEDNFPAARYFIEGLKALESADVDDRLEKRKKKPKKNSELDEARQKRDEFYMSKYHEDDDYGRWAKSDSHLKRGLHESRIIREVLWSKPGQRIADVGAGLGKLWRADEDGYIHDESEFLKTLTAEERQKLGLGTKHNLRLPPRPDNPEDPIQTVDQPSSSGMTDTVSPTITLLDVNGTTTAMAIMASDAVPQTTSSSRTSTLLDTAPTPSNLITADVTKTSATTEDAAAPVMSSAMITREHARDLSHGVDQRALSSIHTSGDISELISRQAFEISAIIGFYTIYAIMLVDAYLTTLSVFAIVAGVIALIVQLSIMLMTHHPKNPEGKVHFDFDWDNIPYQYDDKYQKMDATPPSPTAEPPPGGCDTWDMSDLERRGWTTTQYAMHACPTAIPQECSREWYELRASEKDAKHITSHNRRRNPVYCWEHVFFKTNHHKDAYTQARQQELHGAGQFSQYAGHTLAELDGCLEDGQKMLGSKKCRSKYMHKMEHHNIEQKKCEKKKPSEICDIQESRYLRITTGWPKNCKKGEASCWEDASPVPPPP